MEKQFIDAFADLVRQSMANDHDDNHDTDRFGPERNRPSPVYRFLRWFAQQARLLPRPEVEAALSSSLELLRGNTGHLQWLYDKLADNESKQLLVLLASYRALGHRKVKLPLSSQRHRATVRRVQKMAKQGESMTVAFNNWSLHRMDLAVMGFPLSLYATAPAVVTQFIEQQYRCEADGSHIEAAEGDFVVDAGGCWGDTALYFAHMVGESGRVLSCEFLEDNLSVYRKNLELNAELASRIEIVQRALWAESGLHLDFIANGPGTSVARDVSSADLSVATTTLDDLISGRGWPRVDFIKMDIEGAELMALQGAEFVLRTYRPKLAITVYHRFRDFWEIPQFIDSLGLGYQFYLRHFKMHAEETVLFARA
jgi:FkbM family methyltransferase